MKKEIKNILIVDDEEDICFLVKSILKRKSSARIDICTSVKDAIEKLSSEDYDLAFFDMRLNDGTGSDLIDFVHSKLDTNPYIAVISAYTSDADMEKLRELKINQFIPKPLSREKIIGCYVDAMS
ncbi:MAG: response regulator [Crocinitomicaceae bacterium]